MLLAFDIGNTTISLGGFRGESLEFDIQLATDRTRTQDEYAVLLLSLLERKIPKGCKISRCIIASVVPPLTQEIASFVRELFDVESIIVGPGVKSGIAIGTSEPSAVGTDRVANSLAVKTLYGTPALVVDFSTATSIDFVNKDGVYSGGIIMPGFKVGLDALVERTAQLPPIDLATMPDTVIGRNTKEAMQSGALLGYLSMIEEMVRKALDEVGQVNFTVATGQHGKLFASHSNLFETFDPHLTLRGLQIMSQLNT